MGWRAVKASQVLKALLSKGWKIKRQKGSHRVLAKMGRANVIFAFHDQEEIGPRMLSRIAKRTGLSDKDI
jgi:predicted RNA binding protein YcfA (HicA-like mRNA interferase family)